MNRIILNYRSFLAIFRLTGIYLFIYSSTLVQNILHYFYMIQLCTLYNVFSLTSYFSTLNFFTPIRTLFSHFLSSSTLKLYHISWNNCRGCNLEYLLLEHYTQRFINFYPRADNKDNYFFFSINNKSWYWRNVRSLKIQIQIR